ncbi:MAG: hypothetical protein NTW94_07810 [Legionellales bacterium]|nr:hypothetical protein [Legionellales bacterium]
MALKKAPRNLSLSLLTSGASIILGCLSFGGMFVLWPVLPLAFTAFGLSVAYEGEIYLQNITNAWSKLFKHKALQHQMAREYLRTHFPNVNTEPCPAFFKDYQIQLHLHHRFGHKKLDKMGRLQKRRVEKTLTDMEKRFSHELFLALHPSHDKPTPYEQELRQWLLLHEQTACIERFTKRQQTFQGVKAFSTVAALFMSLGTTYLLMEAFAIIPFLATISITALPIIIVPMALIAGTAYGFLTYNAVTDMMTNDTLKNWYHKLRQDLSQGFTLRNVFMTTMAACLVLLAVALTLCTAGTWWTVAQEARPLFSWMAKLPTFIMGIVNPIITGLSALVFNLQNTSESLELIDEATKTSDGFFSRAMASIKEGFQKVRASENTLQLLNPFRFLLKITIMPLRILFFLGHLVSIGLTADRVPGVSQVLSALLGIISEGFEDFHYFVGHDTHEHSDHHSAHHQQDLLDERLGAGHGHHHNMDLPTRLIQFIATPIYFLAAVWDHLSSQNNNGTRAALSFKNAWDKQKGTPKTEATRIPKEAKRPSAQWQKEQLLYRIERHKEKQLSSVTFGREVALKKINALTTLQEDLKQIDPTNRSQMKARLDQAKADPIYSQHRFFDTGPTETTLFLQDLPQRVY